MNISTELDTSTGSPNKAQSGNPIQQKLSSMHRLVTKQVYEIEAMVNSVYYGKVVAPSMESRINTDFMSSNFGYEQSAGGSPRTGNLKEVDEAQVQFMQSKISSIQVYYEDIK